MFKIQSNITILEYVWIGGKNEIRSKTKIFPSFLHFSLDNMPIWNYDGSSTWQATSDGDTEVTLVPCALFHNPLRVVNDCASYIVLCDTYNMTNVPLNTNNRFNAVQLFNKYKEKEPWFGLEQEFFIEFNETIDKDMEKCVSIDYDGYHYCGTSRNRKERIIVEQHLEACLKAGIRIAGINAEVSNKQWEFQVGPCEGITMGDELLVARFLLERIAEQHNATINYHPKPYPDINGSGCHINFSTVDTRNENGIETISTYIYRLGQKHNKHVESYGVDNHLRLTGLNETSSIDTFSWGVGTRNTSIRIPNQTMINQKGYFEDRRPSSNIDPYLATHYLFHSCMEHEYS